MKEHPIIFSGEMVRAILEGRKTQTRRVVKPQPTEAGLEWKTACGGEFAAWEDSLLLLDEYSEDGGPCQRTCPYGKPGDRLWVRETHAFLWPESCPDGVVWEEVSGREVPIEDEDCDVEYRADTGNPYPGQWPRDEAAGNPEAPKWRPSIYMPRWASRINLTVTDVRVERVQDITTDGMRDEGLRPDSEASLLWRENLTDKWIELWDSINAQRGLGWDVNPWVWVITFEMENEP